MDDFYRLRIDREKLIPPPRSAGDGGSPAFIGQVTTTTPVVGQFFLVRPVAAGGVEVAGGTGTETVSTQGQVAVYALGPAAPKYGDYLVCHFVDFRWVAERMTTPGNGGGAGGIGTIPFCFCSAVPETLSMVSASSTCNYSMFQTCTIQYGPIPPVYAPLSFGSLGFVSVQSFPDPLAGGALFQYYLTCQYNVWTLSRLYATSPWGSPFIDGNLYVWYVGSPGNTCAGVIEGPGTPFALTNGQPYPGSDASCSVAITPT